MPLSKVRKPTKSHCRDNVSKNIKTLMDEGRPQPQAVAIALSVARKAGCRVRKQKLAGHASGATVARGYVRALHDNTEAFMRGDVTHASFTARNRQIWRAIDAEGRQVHEAVLAQLRKPRVGHSTGRSPHMTVHRIAVLDDEKHGMRAYVYEVRGGGRVYGYQATLQDVDSGMMLPTTFVSENKDDVIAKAERWVSKHAGHAAGRAGHASGKKEK